MKVVPALLVAMLTALSVFLYSRVVDLSERARNAPSSTIIRQIEVREGLNQDLALKLIQSTVRVSQVGRQGNGTGVVIYSERVTARTYYHLVLTAAHCTSGADQMAIERFSYKDDKTVDVVTLLLADTIFEDNENDIAILRVWDALPFPYVAELITAKDLESIRLYEPLYAVGCPLGALPFITNGNLSGINVADGKHIAFTAPVSFGNSGGAVFTAGGKIMGVVRMMSRMPTGQPYPHSAFAVPAWTVESFLRANKLGFIVKADDGSSFAKLDAYLTEKAKQEKKAREEKEEKERRYKEDLKKAMEEFMRNLKPIDPQLEPK